MPKRKVTFSTVRTIALKLPGAVDATTYGAPCFKAGGKLMACVAVHKSAEPDTRAVRVDYESREAMIEDAPHTYYLTDHYVNHPFVLVRLKTITPDALKDLLFTAWRLATAKSAKSGKTRKPGNVRTSQKP